MKHHQVTLRRNGPLHACQYFSRLAGYNSDTLCGLEIGLSKPTYRTFVSGGAASCKRCSKAHNKL